MSANSLDFAVAARTLGRSARGLGLVVPSFRSPPRIDAVDRSLRRGRNGWVTVSVRLGDRPLGAVIADMIEGIVVANGLDGGESTRVRTVLWEAISATAPQRNGACAA